MRVGVELLCALAGAALLLCAWAADRQWLDRHFLPPFFVTRRVYLLAAMAARFTAAVLGILLLLVARPRLGRFAARVPPARLAGSVLRVLLAVALALGASELVLRFTFRRSSEEQPASQIPYRRPDPRLGWVFVPSRTERTTAGGRTIEYAFDSAGYRVRRANQPVDPDRPSILFTGESTMAGQGVNWDETAPAQVEALLGVQSVNLAVHGFGSDQAYMRLLAELPRFRQPLAVISLFTPGLFDRNLDEDRPHLGPGLVWLPPKPRWRLAIIAGWLAPYRSEEAIERGIAVTRAVLRATVDLARSRGATPLIVVPQFLPEDPTERVLRRRILDEPGLPYVWVPLDPSWRLPRDLHPDPRGMRAMAAAIAARVPAPY